MRKLLFLIALALPTVAAAQKPASPNTGKKLALERVVAVVNDAIILQSELEARLVPVRAEAEQIQDATERRRRLAKLASQVLDEMVNEELIVQAADAAKVEVDSSEVQAALDEIKTISTMPASPRRSRPRATRSRAIAPTCAGNSCACVRSTSWSRPRCRSRRTTCAAAMPSCSGAPTR